MNGITVTPLKIIANQEGDIFHVIRNFDKTFVEFGEAYFSFVKPRAIKAWKKHLKMTLNLVVPIGVVKFVIFDDRPESTTQGQFNEFILSSENYCRLTLSPNLWFGFAGLSSPTNLILNVADIPHDPNEAIRCPIEAIPFAWF